MFVIFLLGECGTGDFGVFTCNGTKRWCIGEVLVCQNLNPCTDDSDCPKVTPEEIVFNITGVVIPIIIFLLFIACCCCIIQTGTNSSFRGRCEEGSRTAVQLVRGIWDCMRNGRIEMVGIKYSCL